MREKEKMKEARKRGRNAALPVLLAVALAGAGCSSCSPASGLLFEKALAKLGGRVS